MTTTMRTSLCLATASLTLLASGCGGGSGGDLRVDFAYPDNYAYLFRPATMDIQGIGLQGNTPTCSVIAGTLPAGLSLQQSGCRISGTPTEVKVAFVTIRLTVSGFDGQVDKEVRIESVGPPLNYSSIVPTVVGAVVSYRPASTATTAWAPQLGEAVVYSVASGALPQGLSLDAATGEIAGILTSTAANEFVVGVSVSGPLGTATSASQRSSVRVGAGGLTFFYGPNDTQVVATVGSNLSLTPLFNFGSSLDPSLYTFSNFRVSPAGAALPAGLTLDPATGALTGTVPNTPGTLDVGPFQVELTAAGKTATFTSSPLVLFVPTP